MSVLRINNLSVRLNSNGLISDSLGQPAMVNKNGMGLLDNAGVWMSATDSAGNLRTAAHSLLVNSHEFWGGPLELKNEIPASNLLWDKVYPVYQSEVNYHIAHYKDNGYSPVSNIAKWPGSAGSPYAQVLAPFVDVEVNDQVYNPTSGDYPYLKTDGLIYSISNDRYSAHNYSGGLPLGIELHTSVSGFAGDSLLGNCILVKYTVFNRSDRDYDNFRLSPVFNYGIGNISNEYLGTEIGANAMYTVNDTSEATFSGRLVSLVCMAVNRKISSTMYFENSADPINGRPDSAVHFSNLMQARWKNGQFLNYGSNGVDGSGSARFVYPDTTDKSNGGFRWLDQVPGEKFGIMNFDSLELKRGKSLQFELALFYVEENNYNIKQIGVNCLKIKQALIDRNMVKLVEKPLAESSHFRLYPNPAKIGDKVYLGDLFEVPMGIRLIDMQGKEIIKLNLDINDKSVILPPDLKPGVYILECKTLNEVKVQKLILN